MHCKQCVRQMISHYDSRRPAILLVAMSLLLVACGPGAAPPAPTRAPAPTFTPTPEGQQPALPVSANPQPVTNQQGDGAGAEQPPASGQQDAPAAEAPTDTPAPPPTDTPAPASVVINTQGMNIRGGPGTNYNIVGAAQQNERFSVKGKSPDGTWWQIDFNGQDGWVFGELVRAENTQAVAVALNIPAPPPPTNTPVPPPPTNTPVAQAPAPAPPPAQNDNFPFLLLDTVTCAPNAATTYFNGFVRYRNNSPRNAVCVHIDYYGPRNTKCSGCDGVGDGNWGFSPFGGPAPAGTTVSIWVVACPSGPMPAGGQTQQSGFGDLTPQSPKWTHTVQSSEQCTGITFVSRNE